MNGTVHYVRLAFACFRKHIQTSIHASQAYMLLRQLLKDLQGFVGYDLGLGALLSTEMTGLLL